MRSASLVLPLPREEGLPAGHVGEARLDGLGGPKEQFSVFISN